MQAPSQIQPVAVPQQPVIVVITQPNGKTYVTYKAKASVRLGALQIVIGILCILFNVAAMVLNSPLSYLGHGIWGGFIFILAGSFGVSAGKYQTYCLIKASMMLSMTSAMLPAVVVTFSAIGVMEDDDDSYSDNIDSRMAMHAVLIALAVLEAMIAIVSSAIGCGAVSCGRRPWPANSAQGAQYINQPGQQQILISNPGQPGVNVGQPGIIVGQPGVTTVPQQHTVYPTQTQVWALPPNQAPGTYYAQPGPPPVGLPQGVTPPGYTTASPPGCQQWAPAPQAWSTIHSQTPGKTLDPANPASLSHADTNPA